MTQRLAAYLEQLRGAFAREALPPPPELPRPAHPARRSFAELLLAIEPLPLGDEPARRRGPGLVAALFTPERLPTSPERARPRPRTQWFRWLVVPERLDP
jgi:hypothetical protein